MTTNRESPSHLVAGVGRAPRLVILGAPRCGTTALSKWLADAGIGTGVKDSFYLMDDDAGLRGRTHLDTHGVDGYLSLFPQGSTPVVECTAGYLYQDRALDFFRRWSTPPTFAVVVRDPVIRLRSVHRYFAGNLGVLPKGMGFADFVDALFAKRIALPDRTVSDALRQGRYAAALKPWADEFGSGSVHVFRFDDMAASPVDVVARLIELAGGVPRSNLVDYQFSARNESYIPDSPLVAGLTGWAREWVPGGRTRTWGGDLLRRLHADRHDAELNVPSADDDQAATERLREFYAQPNRELSERFGVNTSLWT